MDFNGTVFRAHNPRWSWSPLSGDGAKRYGGRFNPIGTPALYTSVKVSTAMLEACPLGRAFQPLTLVSYRVTAQLFDATDSVALSALGFAEADLAYKNWERDMLGGSVPRQHRLATALIGQGVHGLFVRSFARGASAEDTNIVLWAWGETGADIALVDDEGRLPKDDASWHNSKPPKSVGSSCGWRSGWDVGLSGTARYWV